MSDDPRLSALIKEGRNGDIVFVGYPFEHAALRMRRKGGEENGPCCLRRFYGKIGPLVNSQYEIDLRNLKVTDYGNIVGDPKNPKQLEQELKNVVSELLANNQISIVFGGSRQTTVATTNSFSEKYPQGKKLYFSGYPSVLRPYDNDKLSSNSVFQMLPQAFRGRSVLIGTNEKYWPSSSKVEISRIDITQIRKSKLPQLSSNIFDTRTQAGTVIKTLLQNQTSDNIYASFSMDVIKNFMGTYYKPFDGLSIEQMLEIMMILGRDQRVKCLDLTEFNPANEDYNSSLTILNMVYYFLMGYTQRDSK